MADNNPQDILSQLTDEQKQQLMGNPFVAAPGLAPAQNFSAPLSAINPAQAGTDSMFMGPPSPSQEELAARNIPDSAIERLIKSVPSKSLSSTPPLTPSSAPTQNRPSVQDILNQLSGQNDQALNSAIANRNKMNFISMLGQSANQILGGQTHTRPDNSVWQQLAAQGEQGINDIAFKNKLLNEKLSQQKAGEELVNSKVKGDPNSDISKVYREMAEQMTGRKLPGTMSASDLEKISPIFEKMFAAKESAKDRAARSADTQSYRESLLGNKAEDKLLKYSKAMGEDLDPNRQRSGEAGKNQARVNAAERLEGLLNQFPDGNIPQIQTRELATALGNLLSSGASQQSVTQINELVPHTMSGNYAKIAEWFTNNPTGQQQQQFIKMYADTASREKAIAQRQILQGQFKKANSSHHKLKELSPDDWYNNLSTATGIDTDEIKAMESKPGFKGQYEVPQTSNNQTQKINAPNTPSNAHPQDDEAVAWAKANPGPKADAILKANGIK